MTALLILSVLLILSMSGSGARSEGTFLSDRDDRKRPAPNTPMASIVWNCQYLDQMRADPQFRIALDGAATDVTRYNEVIAGWIEVGGPSQQLAAWPELAGAEYLQPMGASWPELLAFNEIKLHYSRASNKPDFCVACEHSPLQLPKQLWGFRPWHDEEC